ncbi:MAG: AAA family ATPase [Clostridiales Family XIII bacterium]|jgi:exodeoxyribonuclease V alpha subunit|nr:AAA family ATPase [Clostridiales Family XIII bacterium]
MEEKTCTLTDIIYHNDENSFTVGVFQEAGGSFTGTGYIPGAARGRRFRLTGVWKEHGTYGRQFSFSGYSEEMPDTNEAIELFLASGAIKGIGGKTAQLIVSAFGGDTLRIMGEEPQRLTEISGIGPKKAAMISGSFREHRDLAEVTLYFQQFGISAKAAMKLFRVYGDATIAAVNENPYQLIDDVFGIGFKSADRIALRMGLDMNSKHRIKSGVKYLLWQHVGDGNTFVPHSGLLEHAAILLDVAMEDIEDSILEMVFEGEVRLEALDGRNVVFLEPYYMAEQNVCKNLMRLERAALMPIQADVEDLISMSERESGVALSENQKYAVRESLNNGVFVITGGPGTGKTTIISTIISIFKTAGLNTGVAAPTGRAAKRISETTGHEASTIHRMLEYYYSESDESMRFRRTEENPLEYGAVIVDEASMIDIMLMNGLLRAIPSGTRLIVVGDADQLPPVGAGNVLRDMLDSEAISSVRLDEIFRQAKESMIVVNAHCINKGEYPELNRQGRDFFLLTRKGERNIADTLTELCVSRLPKYYDDCDMLRDLQVLTPVRKGALGCISLNAGLQAALNPPSDKLAEKAFGDKLFRVGDKVMQIKNNYQLQWRRAFIGEGQGGYTGGGGGRADQTGCGGEGRAAHSGRGAFPDSWDDDDIGGEGVFNGDVGFIRGIDLENGTITVVFDESRFVEYDFSQSDELELAYAITVHKSQGSEFQLVLMPISAFPPMLATRNLLYTAVTRGKKAVILVGSEHWLRAMVDNDHIKERYSGLCPRLRAFLQSAEGGESGEGFGWA